MATSSLPELQFVIKAKNYEVVSQIISAGCDLNGHFRNCTALSLAVLSNDARIVELLLVGRADPNIRSKDASGRLEPPLVTACRMENLKIVQLLLAWSAKIDVKDFYGHTALWMASKQLRPDIVDLLLQNGARPGKPSLWSECPLFYCLREMDTSRSTREEIAKKLIQSGFRSDCKDSKGHDAFYWAVLHRSSTVATLILGTGYRPSRNFVEENQEPLMEMSLEFLQLLVFIVANVSSLLELCKLTIRRQLEVVSEDSKEVKDKLKKLEVPKSLVEFLGSDVHW